MTSEPPTRFSPVSCRKQVVQKQTSKKTSFPSWGDLVIIVIFCSNYELGVLLCVLCVRNEGKYDELGQCVTWVRKVLCESWFYVLGCRYRYLHLLFANGE